MHVNPQIAALLERLNNPSLPGIDLSLERMWQLLAALGNPQDALPPVIYVAGTNGKGSTIAFLNAIYSAAGYRVHAYTSPHLVRFNERIRLAGEEISDAALLPLLEEVAAAATHIPVTFFEATTAAAFLTFSRTPADVILLETGLGGRLDATNVVAKPALTILTPIHLDHMEFLGDNIPAIAMEKAGILKPQVPCIMGAQTAEAEEVIMRVAMRLDVPVIALGKQVEYSKTASDMALRYQGRLLNLPVPALVGEHQYHNAAVAASAVLTLAEMLPAGADAIAAGIGKAIWPARLQRLMGGALVESWYGEVYLDGAHNHSGAQMLAQWMCGKPYVTVLCGMMRRKSIEDFLQPMAPHIQKLVAVPIAGEDCHPPQAIAEAARAFGIADVQLAKNLGDAPALLQGAASGTLLACGSLFLAGEILKNHR